MYMYTLYIYIYIYICIYNYIISHYTTLYIYIILALAVGGGAPPLGAGAAPGERTGALEADRATPLALAPSPRQGESGISGFGQSRLVLSC
jgi:hypothetical protein